MPGSGLTYNLMMLVHGRIDTQVCSQSSLVTKLFKRDKLHLNTPYVFLAGYPVIETTKEDLAAQISSRIDSRTKSILFFANTNFVVQCRALLSKLQSEDVLIVNDGVGMDIACKLIHGRKFATNLNGTDFTPYFLTHSERSYRVFLVGGRPEILNKAAYFLVHQLGQSVVGSCDGFDGIKNTDLVKAINSSKAEVVLVAMGNPRQEKWILDHYQLLDANLFSGVGALFDFWAGDKPRAPNFVQKLRMEWFYRLCIEPRRLIKRYSADVLVFLVHCIRFRKLNSKS